MKNRTVTINIPFTYELGEMGTRTGKILETVEDCKQEVLAEIEEGVLSQDPYMEAVDSDGELITL